MTHMIFQYIKTWAETMYSDSINVWKIGISTGQDELLSVETFLPEVTADDIVRDNVDVFDEMFEKKDLLVDVSVKSCLVKQRVLPSSSCLVLPVVESVTYTVLLPRTSVSLVVLSSQITSTELPM